MNLRIDKNIEEFKRKVSEEKNEPVFIRPQKPQTDSLAGAIRTKEDANKFFTDLKRAATKAKKQIKGK